MLTLMNIISDHLSDLWWVESMSMTIFRVAFVAVMSKIAFSLLFGGKFGLC